MARDNRKSPVRSVAVIPAAGSGVRMGSKCAKQFLELAGRPMLAATLERFQSCRAIGSIFPVVPPEDVEYCRKEIVHKFGFDKVRDVVKGGRRRQDSVRFGLEAAGDDFDLVVIHDGVRPLVDESFIETMVSKADEHRAVVAGRPAHETIKEVDGRGLVLKTCERGRIWVAQTPQVFRYKDILEAHQKAVRQGRQDAPDDSCLVESLGVPVTMVEGPENNLKVTTPHDLALAQFLCRHERMRDR